MRAVADPRPAGGGGSPAVRREGARPGAACSPTRRRRGRDRDTARSARLVAGAALAAPARVLREAARHRRRTTWTRSQAAAAARPGPRRRPRAPLQPVAGGLAASRTSCSVPRAVRCSRTTPATRTSTATTGSGTCAQGGIFSSTGCTSSTPPRARRPPTTSVQASRDAALTPAWSTWSARRPQAPTSRQHRTVHAPAPVECQPMRSTTAPPRPASRAGSRSTPGRPLDRRRVCCSCAALPFRVDELIAVRPLPARRVGTGHGRRTPGRLDRHGPRPGRTTASRTRPRRMPQGGPTANAESSARSCAPRWPPRRVTHRHRAFAPASQGASATAVALARPPRPQLATVRDLSGGL